MGQNLSLTPAVGVRPTLAVPAVEFPRFKSLPIEIQEMIWDAALKDIGAVRVRIERRRMNIQGEFKITSSGIPAPLHVSRQSRKVAQRYFQLYFGAVHGRFQYFNLENDILELVGFRRFLTDPDPFPAILNQIRWARNVLMLEYPDLVRGEHSWYFDIREQIPQFLSLRTFIYQDIELHQFDLSILMFSDFFHQRRLWRDVVIQGIAEYWDEVVNPDQVENGVPRTTPPVVFFCDSQGVIQTHITTKRDQ